ncbi:hypothetical protein BF93_06440 [Brachybacterium phenoliresistens]|uniref:DUF4878 domain-containing protein n=1 Tax=Brachybacterium phenoliresistens TaxID=396014 RepID=Z9JXT2_9MICO|nr:hypothetical protein [Brachybacterium phenoliresistens]EWS82974.1 hypothetical protein BF93_06440 [Brachybacterium phenoliresistens]
MNSIVRRAGRGSTLLVGSVALAFSLAACGGGSEDPAEPTAEETAAEETTEDTAAEETTEEAAEEATEETTEEGAEDPAAGGEVTDEDLTAAKEQFVAFVGALGEQDAAKACGFMLDPSTGEPVSDANLETCTSQLESTGMMDTFTPEVASMITTDMINATGNPDGTITLDMSGSKVNMAKASDGKWYFTV